MNFGIYANYWTKNWNDTFEEMCRKCKKSKELGFDVLELNAIDLAALEPEKLEYLKSTAEEEGIRLTAGSGLTKKYDTASKDPNVREAGIDYLKRTFECLDRANIHKLAGMMYGYWPVDFSEGIDKEGTRERSIVSLRKIADAAASHNIKLMLEVANRYECYLLNTSEEAVSYVKDVGKDNVYVMLDSFHMNIEEDNIGEAIRLAGRHLGHMHIGEANRRVPGKGHIPWKEIGSALHDINYQDDIVLEPFVLHNCQVGDDIKVWRDLSYGEEEKTMDKDLKESLIFLKKEFKII